MPGAVELLERGIEDGLHLGAQLVVSVEGTRVLDAAVGEASPGVPMDRDTVLPWQSLTKVLTALALARQWERGEVTLDDPVAGHVPAFAAAGKERVTVRHLLTHTGGLRNAVLAPTEAAGMGWQESLDTVCAAPLVDGWVPGTRAAYQPRGTFLVLAELVRLVDGRPFEAYVRDEVLAPFGLRATSLFPPLGAAPLYADGNPLPLPDSCRPSAGAVGPAHELAQLFEALLAGGEPVVSTPTLEAMTARHRVALRDETFGVAMDWGLGFIVDSWHYQRRPTPYGFGDFASPRTFGHGGSESSLAFADPERRLVLALICNGLPGEKANHTRTQSVVDAVYEELGFAVAR